MLVKLPPGQTPDTLLVMTCILFLLSGKMHRLYLVENHRQVRDCCAVIGRLLNGRFWQICTISAVACCNILEKFFLLQTLIVLTPKFLLKEGLPYNYQRVSRSEKQRVLLIICRPNDWEIAKNYVSVVLRQWTQTQKVTSFQGNGHHLISY